MRFSSMGRQVFFLFCFSRTARILRPILDNCSGILSPFSLFDESLSSLQVSRALKFIATSQANQQTAMVLNTIGEERKSGYIQKAKLQEKVDKLFPGKGIVVRVSSREDTFQLRW
jgi:hypothetical protein